MNSLLKYKLEEVLKNEGTEIMRSDEEISAKIRRMNEIVNIIRILDDYEELEPLLKKYYKEKYNKEKMEEER